MEIVEHAWAAFWPSGTPRAFILANTARDTRRASCEAIGKTWAREGGTEMQGWKRAYRAGCRVGRVTLRLNPAYFPHQEPKQ